MLDKIIEKLKQSYCLGLRADIGLGLASDACEILLYPSNNLLRDYRGLIFIAIAKSENDIETAESRKGLAALGLDRIYAELDAIVGYAELDSIVEYSNDADLSADIDSHGVEGTLADLRAAMQSNSVFGYHFANRCLLKDFIFDVGAAIGRVWQAADPQDAYNFRQAFKGEVV